MKRYIFTSILLICAIIVLLTIKQPVSTSLKLKPSTAGRQADTILDLQRAQEEILNYLKLRKDDSALREAERVLMLNPDDHIALWAKAEVLRRNYQFGESEIILHEVLSKNPDYAPALISLSYIKYQDFNFEDAGELIDRVLGQSDLSPENKGLAYMLIGSINAKKASSGGWLRKIAYGMRIKGYFEKAKTIAPELSEVYLGLGSFYLLAPKIAGGDINKAIEELETAVRLTPDFATANARLAQAYKRKGNLAKYNLYLERVKKLDPGNEVLKTLEE